MDPKKCLYFATFLFLYFFFVVTNSCLISIQILSFDRYIFDENVITTIVPITLGSLMLLTWWISTSGCHNKERKEKPTPWKEVLCKKSGVGPRTVGPKCPFLGVDRKLDPIGMVRCIVVINMIETCKSSTVWLMLRIRLSSHFTPRYIDSVIEDSLSLTLTTSSKDIFDFI